MNKMPQHVKASCIKCKNWICRNRKLKTPSCVRMERFPHFDFEFNAIYFDSAHWCLCDFEIEIVDRKLPSQSETFLANVPKMKKKIKTIKKNG